MSHFDWRGKVVIISGASSGIGQALAEHLAARGVRLGLLGRDLVRLEGTAAAVRIAGSPAVASATADVCDQQATLAAIQSLEAQLGPSDVLIASAGIHRFSNGRKFDTADAREVIATNVIGVINLFGAVLPGMLARKQGRLVAISSIAGVIALPTAGAYCASKAALLTLCHTPRLDLRSTGVQFTAILPGFVDTPLLGDHDRSNIGIVLSPQDAARRIAQAVERGRRNCVFPLRTWLLAKLVSKLPFRVSSALWRRLERQKKRKGEFTTEAQRRREDYTNT